MSAAGRETPPTRRADRQTGVTVAIVGAPNVGKSRLFNRLTGSRSIVHDRPGVTRDRIEAICEWSGSRFRVLDTGGLVPGDPDELTREVRRQVLKGVEEADLLVFVVSGRDGLTPLDQALAQLLRTSNRPVILAVNKVDAEGQEGRLSEFFRLGFPDPLPISAEEGRGIGQLLDRIVEVIPREALREPRFEGPPESVRLAVVGRPNVGKSTLFNRLAGNERSVVSSVPGTTRDPVGAEFVHRGRHFKALDTAGLRRKARVEGEVVEVESVDRAFSAIRAADIVLAVLDATEPASHQDLAVIGECQKLRRPLLVALNKIDRLPPAQGVESALAEVRKRLRFSSEVPIVPVSALKGAGADEILSVLHCLSEECNRRIPTPDLNAALEEAVRLRSPSSPHKVPRLYYITQTGQFPPSFLVFTNGARIEPTYQRFLARHLRKAFGFQLAPVALKFRRRDPSSRRVSS